MESCLRLHKGDTNAVGRNYTYYMANGQTLLGENVDNAKYLSVKAKGWKEFFREHPYESLPKVYESM